MQKKIYYNNKTAHENNDKKRLIQSSYVDTKNIVDINILLNRVKIEEKYQLKKKIIFFSSITFTLILFGIFIAIIR